VDTTLSLTHNITHTPFASFSRTKKTQKPGCHFVQYAQIVADLQHYLPFSVVSLMLYLLLAATDERPLLVTSSKLMTCD
jgi:hypothetical protein